MIRYETPTTKIILHIDDTMISLEEFKKIDGSQESLLYLIHNEDMPSIIENDYTKYWYLNGQLHRVTGPAIDASSSPFYYGKPMMWYEYNKRHRLYGPAIIYTDGSATEEYYLWNKEYTKEDYMEAMQYLNDNDMEAFKLRYG